MTRPPFFPMMIDLLNKHVLIIGGGIIASRRADTLIKCGAIITAISPEFSQDFPENTQKIIKPFESNDITQKFTLIIAATNNKIINQLVYQTAKKFNIPVNVCDSQEKCDFFFPSLINHENISVSVCSAGLSAKLTKKLSDRLRKIWSSWVIDEKSLCYNYPKFHKDKLE